MAFDLKELLDTAKNAREGAYAPYSRFTVGAAVIGESGKVYTGCNIENASYGLTVCAERVAIWKAVSEGETSIAAIAIVTGGPDIPRPCGACLQVMQEFSAPGGGMAIAAGTVDGDYDTYILVDYLPKPFILGDRGGS